MREIYGQPPLSERAVGAYFEALRDLPDDDVAKLLGESLKSNARVPLPSEIRQTVAGRSVRATPEVKSIAPDPELVDAVCQQVAKDIASNTGPIWAALRGATNLKPSAD